MVQLLVMMNWIVYSFFTNRRTFAVTDSSFVRGLNLEMSMKLRMPLIAKVVISCTTSSSSSVTWICKASDCCHVGHCDGEESHFGPCFHSSDEFRVSYEIPLVSRSARLSAKGQYLQVAGLERISFTWWLTNGFKDFLLFIHARTIWLSDQRQTIKETPSDVVM